MARAKSRRSRDGDDSWVIEIEGFEPLQERAAESLMALSNGYLGTRASVPEGNPASDPATFVAGVYEKPNPIGLIPELVGMPGWSSFSLEIEGEAAFLDGGDLLDHRRQLDLRRAEWTRTWRHRDRNGRITRFRFLECASLADRHVLLQRVEVTPENYTGSVTLTEWIDTASALRAEPHSDFLAGADRARARAPIAHLKLLANSHDFVAVQTLGTQVEVAFASDSVFEDLEPIAKEGPQAAASKAWTLQAELGTTYRLDRVLTVFSSRDGRSPGEAAVAHLATLMEAGFDALLQAHEKAWAQRWRSAAVELDGDPVLARALHLAAYHLIGASNPDDEHVSIGARGLTGKAYRGHVFWDTEIFMLPFFVFTDPQAARALLMYRFHTLPAAREKAKAMGYQGALYAWESADDGKEATPAEVLLPDGEVVPILCGASEHHISADIAYAVWRYWKATGDDEFFLSAGAEVLLETARFWASRAEQGADGRYHIRAVIGPDEYHEVVDDNAYTNLLARWNLRRGDETASLLAGRWKDEWNRLSKKLGLTPAETGTWTAIAEGLVDGLDPGSGIIEQFDGYNDLDDIDLASFEPRTVPMDLVLGHERILQTKVIKQADVLMALALLWEEFPEQVREANFRYYEPRTGHGSSLSPGVHADLAARLGDLGRAERYLRQTAAIDLDDQLANASGGVHMAALGGLWQAVVFGFVGVEALDDRLVVRPRLGRRWRSLVIPLQWRGRHLRLEVQSRPRSWQIRLESGEPLVATRNGEPAQPLAAGSSICGLKLGQRWELQEEVAI